MYKQQHTNITNKTLAEILGDVRLGVDKEVVDGGREHRLPVTLGLRPRRYLDTLHGLVAEALLVGAPHHPPRRRHGVCGHNQLGDIGSGLGDVELVRHRKVLLARPRLVLRLAALRPVVQALLQLAAPRRQHRDVTLRLRGTQRRCRTHLNPPSATRLDDTPGGVYPVHNVVDVDGFARRWCCTRRCWSYHGEEAVMEMQKTAKSGK